MIWDPIPADHMIGMTFLGLGQEEFDKNLSILLDYVSQLVLSYRCSIQTRKDQMRHAMENRTNWNMFWAIHEAWSYVHGEFTQWNRNEELYRLFGDLYRQLSKTGPRGPKTPSKYAA